MNITAKDIALLVFGVVFGLGAGDYATQYISALISWVCRYFKYGVTGYRACRLLRLIRNMGVSQEYLRVVLTHCIEAKGSGYDRIFLYDFDAPIVVKNYKVLGVDSRQRRAFECAMMYGLIDGRCCSTVGALRYDLVHDVDYEMYLTLL
jgi:hypothetical protein